MRYIVSMSGPTVNMDAHGAVECEPNEIASIAEQMCIDHVADYGYDFDPDAYDDYETVTSELDYYWEEYNPEVHDMHRAGGGSFEEDFKRFS